MAKGDTRSDRIDPGWPAGATDHEHPVGEFTADRQGSLSPFGDEEFPQPAERLAYVHPVTVINR